MPKFGLLQDDVTRGRLLAIRAAVEPILASNLLRSFTDHSVKHADRVCDLIDDLAGPMTTPLDDREAFVLYASAYLHDAGMQHERCGETLAMRRALEISSYAGRDFNGLDEATRNDLIRQHHAAISAEMVRTCVDAPQPTVLGIQLTREDRPGFIAAVCESHTVSADSPRYAELVKPGPSMRTPLLAALLRLADILDETQHRAQLHRELTVQLDAEARMHWWRHYYVSEVTFEPANRGVTLWFEFPPERHDEYALLVPDLQRPWIAAELEAHRGVLAAVGADWHLAPSAFVGAKQASARPMPDEVQLRMVQELRGRRAREETRDQLVALRQLDQAQALVARQLARVRDGSVAPAERLRAAAAFADGLAASSGGEHGAAEVLAAAHAACRNQLSAEELLATTRRLGELLLADGQARRAMQTLLAEKPAAHALQPDDPLRPAYLTTWTRTMLALSALEEAAEAVRQLRDEPAVEPAVLADLEAELAEATLAAGRIGGVTEEGEA